MSERSTGDLSDGAAETREEMLRRAYWRAEMIAFARRRQARDRKAARQRERTHCPECGHRRDPAAGGHAPDCSHMYFPARFIPKMKHPGEFLAGSFVMIDPGIELSFTPIVRLLQADGPLPRGEDPNLDRRQRVPVLLVPTQSIVEATNRMALAVVAVRGTAAAAVRKLAGVLREAFQQMRVLHYYLLTLTVWDNLERQTAAELRALARRIVEAVTQWLDMRVKPMRQWRAAE